MGRGVGFGLGQQVRLLFLSFLFSFIFYFYLFKFNSIFVSLIKEQMQHTKSGMNARYITFINFTCLLTYLNKSF